MTDPKTDRATGARIIPNIWAVGRNYAEHAKELGHAVPSSQSEPLIFLKAGTTAAFDGATIRLPSFSRNVHYELELAFRFNADLHFSEIALAIDVTARDVQEKLKDQGQPWSLAKSFKDSCLLGDFKALPREMDIQNIGFSLKVNGSTRQVGQSRDMIHSVDKLRRYVVDRFPVVPGDVLLTGTPPGVGPLAAGDLLEAEIPGFSKASWRIAST